MATVLRADEGRIRFCEDTISRRNLQDFRRNLGYVPQESARPRQFTTRDFLRYSAWLHEIPKTRQAERIDEAVHRTDLESLLGKRLTELSGGMWQRVLLGQAILHRPPLLILDEPSAGLDPEQRSSFRKVIDEYAQDRVVVLSTHITEDVIGADRQVNIIAAGRLVFRGPVRDVQHAAPAGAGSAIERGFIHLSHQGSRP